MQTTIEPKPVILSKAEKRTIALIFLNSVEMYRGCLLPSVEEKMDTLKEKMKIWRAF